jgi:hypothetical protein
MTKQAWQEHYKTQGPHDGADCAECQARKRTKRASRLRRERDDVMRSCGLTKVIGAVSGRTYWE